VSVLARQLKPAISFRRIERTETPAGGCFGRNVRLVGVVLAAVSPDAGVHENLGCAFEEIRGRPGVSAQ
jgi:hypothetical protein